MSLLPAEHDVGYEDIATGITGVTMSVSGHVVCLSCHASLTDNQKIIPDNKAKYRPRSNINVPCNVGRYVGWLIVKADGTIKIYYGATYGAESWTSPTGEVAVDANLTWTV